MEGELRDGIMGILDTVAAHFDAFRALKDRSLDARIRGVSITDDDMAAMDALQNSIIDELKSLKLNNARIEALVEQLYTINKRSIGLEGKLMRLAESCGIGRPDFAKAYQGHEMDPSWLDTVKEKTKSWTRFAVDQRDRADEIRQEIFTLAQETGVPIDEFRRSSKPCKKGEREALRPRRNGGSQPPLGDLALPEITPIVACKFLDLFKRQYWFDEWRSISSNIVAAINSRPLRLVDPSGHHPLPSRPSAHDSYSVHMIETINKLVRTSRQMLHEIGREPTPEELAEKLGLPLEKVRKVMKIAKEPISLETPIGDEEDSHLGDFIEDKNAILPVEAAIQSNLRETTTRVLASLTPREERVLRMRFSIGMNTDHTLEEVATVQRNPRTHPPNRSQSPAQTQASFAVTETTQLLG